MNKIAIPALLVATVMVAGMFAFVPVEQASTVHGTLTGAGDIDNTELNTALTTIDDFLDTEIGAPVGSLALEADATQDQIAALVSTGTGTLTAGETNDIEDGDVIAAALMSGAGVVYVTVDVTAQAAGGADDTLDIIADATTFATIDLETLGVTTVAIPVTGGTAVSIDENIGQGDAAVSITASYIGASADTT